MVTLEKLDMGAYIAFTRHVTYASLIKHIGLRWLDNDQQDQVFFHKM